MFPSLIICEYATQDKNNKFVLGGVFSGDILMSSFPGSVSIHVYLEFIPQKAGKNEIDIIFKINGKEYARAAIEAFDLEVDVVAGMSVGRLDVNFTEAAKLEIFGSANGSEPVLIKSKLIKQKRD